MKAARTIAMVGASIATLAVALAGWPIVYCYARNRLDARKEGE